MTEWVTIKIPEETRDAAKSDPRTYQQIMEAGLENEPFGSGGSNDLQPVLDRLDDLEAQLPRKVADELQR